MSVLAERDPEVADILEREAKRQREQLELIAAENYTSRAVLEAQGSLLTNKYAEGYPGRRYYAGCREIDKVEALALSRAKALFGAEHANVQPHSGSQANMAAYFTLLSYGDRVLAMSLAHGGHLTHGHRVNFSGRFYQFIPYGVNRETECLDYEEIARLAREHKPKLIVAGASAYPRQIDFARFRQIAESGGALLMVDMAHIAGLVAAGVHPSPIPYADIVTSSTHKTLRGPRGGLILCRADLGPQVDHAVFPGTQGGPLMHVIAAKAVAFGEALKPEFRRYQQAVLDNSRLLAQEMASLGFRIVSGGTENHLVLVDLRNLRLPGKIAEEALEAVDIIVNRNVIPFDPRPLNLTSGIRLGTAAITSRGMGPDEVRRIAFLVYRRLTHLEDEKVTQEVRSEVAQICRRFPLPGVDQ